MTETAVYDLGEILAAGDAYIPPSGPADPGAAAPALRQASNLPEILIPDGSRRWREGASAWLAAQKSKNTGTAYRSEAAKWRAWCASAGVDPFAARRRHADVYARRLTGSIVSQARALALRERGVSVPKIAEKLTIKAGKNAGEHPSIAAVDQALAAADAITLAGADAEQER